MKQIERYGVIALLFMLVTIVTVALWDEGSGDAVKAATKDEGPPAASRDERSTPRGRSEERGRMADQLRSTRASERTRTTPPLTGVDDAGAVGFRADATRGGSPASRSRGTAATRPRADTEERGRPEGPSRSPDDELLASGSRLEDRGERNNRRNGRGTESPRGLEPSSETAPRKKEVKPKPALTGGVYVVVPGDSLERIARRILGDGNRWREIQAMNGGIEPKRLLVGMELALPAGAKTAPGRREAPASTGPAPKSSGRVYVVKSGDILGRIAQRELGSAAQWPKIAALNPGVDPDKLIVGSKIQLPDIGKSGGRPDAARPARSSGSRRVAQADRPAADNPYVVR